MKFVYILLLFVSHSLIARDSTFVRKNTKWDFALNTSYDYSYRKLRFIKTYPDNAILDSVYKPYIDSLNLVEHAASSYTVGVSINYKFNKWLSLKTGLYYSDKAIKSSGFVSINPINGGYKMFHHSNSKRVPFAFLEVPMQLQFYFNPKKYQHFRYHALIGGIACININKHEYDTRRWWVNYSFPELESSYKETEARKFSLFYMGYTAGLGVDYQFSDSFGIGIESLYKFYAKEFTSVGNSKFIAEDLPYSFGCNVSLNFSF